MQVALTGQAPGKNQGRRMSALGQRLGQVLCNGTFGACDRSPALMCTAAMERQVSLTTSAEERCHDHVGVFVQFSAL